MRALQQMSEKLPALRRDLEFLPLQSGGRPVILIRDHLGLVPEGKMAAPHLYQLMVSLDGSNTLRDLQMKMMRMKGGVLVGSDEVNKLLAELDESFLLDSERFKRAKEQIAAEFTAQKTRPCSHCGRSYPHNPADLKKRLDEILTHQPQISKPEGRIKALVAPHIDPTVGAAVYASAYQALGDHSPQRVVILGTGHQLTEGLFCVTEKDFNTPLGLAKNEIAATQQLREAAGKVHAADDFAHRSEHSIEFQLIFLQHLLSEKSFTIIPVLCGSLQANLTAYTRRAYLKKAKPFLEKLAQIVSDPEHETLVVAGVDFSHIGLKFGHDRAADYLARQAEAHDKNLLNHLSRLDAESFWQESIAVDDRFNVCGFHAMACLLEILHESEGKVLGYQLYHEAATQSAVSFAAAIFTTQN
jgi:AmmeMemoRadiSam system protein B